MNFIYRTTLIVGLLVVMFFQPSMGQKVISNKVNQNLSQIQNTPLYEPLKAVTTNDELKNLVADDVLSHKDFFELNNLSFQTIKNNDSKYLRLSLPLAGTDTELQLVKAKVFSDDFSVVAASNPNVALDIDTGTHYHGTVKGKDKSFVVVSFFEDEIKALIQINNEQYTLGKIFQNDNHILYKNRDLDFNPDLSCEVYSEYPVTDSYETSHVQKSNNEIMPCIRLHVEADYTLYQGFDNDVNQTFNHISGLFSQVAILYANDGINLVLSHVKVWDIPSPYPGTWLGQIHSQEFGFKYGDIVQLVLGGGGGGVAWYDVLCSPIKNTSVVHHHGFYSDVPTYSWDVQISAHEIGHNLGVFHTRDCVWNGNNTQIDDCNNSPSVPCFDPDNIIYPPAAGATIMSYCGIIDFTEGFHPQVAARMRSKIAESCCLSACDGIDDSLANCDVGMPCNSNISCTDFGILDDNLNCVPQENIALNKPVTMSSNYNNNNPALLVDNQPGWVATNGTSANDWIDIDLGSEYNINTITIWNRTDCCKNRLGNVYILIADTPFPANTDFEAARENADYAYKIRKDISDNEFSFPVKYNGGRYVRLQKSGNNPGGNHINIEEIQILTDYHASCSGDLACADYYVLDENCDCAPQTNIAPQGTASMKSTNGGSSASFLNDGDFSTIAHTTAGGLAEWMQIDFGTSVPISDIVIHNRTDCCGERLNNVFVLVSDSPLPSQANATKDFLDIAHFEFLLRDVENDPIVTINVSQSGRYVRLIRTANNPGGNSLNIRELEIYSPSSPSIDCNGGGNNDCTNSGGLQATYYNGMNFSGTPISRIDPTVNFNWGTGSPHPHIGNDTYSVRWEGSIEAPTSGSYTFTTATDDGVRLWVNNNLIIDKWINQATTEWSGIINMAAGQKVNIKMEYFENGGGAVAQLLWSGPGVGKQIIPADRLFNCASGSDCTNSDGLKATYYNEMNFSGNFISRVDPTVNFNWGTGSPDPKIGNDTYSVRWEGSIESPTSGSYTFTTATDDGVRLWINNNLIIDKWINQATTEWSGTINMIAGQKVSIKMEYFENGGGAVAQLLWSGPGVGKQIIPSNRLFNCVEGECENVALGKNTSQSSNYEQLTSDKANNGNTNGSDFSHTQYDTNAWWEIDLGAIYNIEDIKIFNRTDCCSQRLSNFHVFVSDAPFSSKSLSGTLNQSGVGNYYFNGAASAVEDFSINRTGRYVRVQLSGAHYLQLSEVQVFACTDTDSSDCDFSLLPGAALDVGAGGGKTFIVGTDRRVYEWNGSGWNIQPAGPQANRIDVEESGIPWVVATDGSIYRLVNNQWQNISGWASDVGCGANQVYVIGGSNRIYRWNGGNSWTGLSTGAGVRIDVHGDGGPWIVGTDGLVYQYIAGNWYPKGNFTAKDIGLKGNGHRIWGLASSNGQVTLYKGNGAWEPQSGAAEHLSVDSNGDVWVVNAYQQIFVNSCFRNLKLASNPTIANLVYPNPTSDKLFLDLDPYYLDKNLDYMITNVQGQLVDRGTLSSIYSDVVEVDVSSSKFPAGTYFLSLTTNDTRQVIKFVVMK